MSDLPPTPRWLSWVPDRWFRDDEGFNEKAMSFVERHRTAGALCALIGALLYDIECAAHWVWPGRLGMAVIGAVASYVAVAGVRFLAAIVLRYGVAGAGEEFLLRFVLASVIVGSIAGQW
jgi:hypothetical protein